MEAQLAPLNVEYELFPAIDGRELAETDALDSLVSRQAAFRIMKRDLTAGEIGAALSHLEIYRTLIDKHIPFACVLEDDTNLSQDFLETLCAIQESPRGDLILLGHWSLFKDNRALGAEYCFYGKSKLTSKRHFVIPAEFPLGAHGYVVMRLAAIKLLNQGLPAWMPADFLTGSAEHLGVSTILVSPPIVVPGLIARKSRIGDKTYIGSRKNERKPSRILKQWIRSSSLFLRKCGIFRESYIWFFNRHLAKIYNMGKDRRDTKYC